MEKLDWNKSWRFFEIINGGTLESFVDKGKVLGARLSYEIAVV